MDLKTLLKAFYALLLLTGMSCTSNKSPENKNTTPDYAEIRETIIKFNFNQSFEVKEIKRSSSIADIHVRGIGFQQSNQTIKFSGVSPLETALVADLDNNGFEELYLITRSMGSGSYARVYGVISVDGSRYKAIYNPENDPKVTTPCALLNNYRGHDSIFLYEYRINILIPSFSNRS